MTGRPVRWSGPLWLAGEGLLLREWTAADLDRMVALFDDPAIDRWTPLESPFHRDAARRYLDQARDRRREGLAVQFAITEGTGTGTDVRAGEPLGELLVFDRGEDVAELGYGVGAAHRGRGLARRALRLVTERGCPDWGFRQLRLRIEPANQASVAVALACGFVRSTEPMVALESKGRRIQLASWERPVRRTV